MVEWSRKGGAKAASVLGRPRAPAAGLRMITWLDEDLAEISDEQVEALATATETLAQLVDVLQRRR